MAGNEILSQEEIDALLQGVDHGVAGGDHDIQARDGIARAYDFASQDRIVRDRVRTIEVINERFARDLQISLFKLLRRSVEVSVSEVRVLKFAEYLHSLEVPSSLNLVRVSPLRGTSLFVFSPKLAFILVDHFFGGDGRYEQKISAREFTATELRVLRKTLGHIFEDFEKAWSSVLELHCDHVGSEVNPQYVTIAGASEAVVISAFEIELDGGTGVLHVTIPYFALEPIRESLGAGIQHACGEEDQDWRAAMRSGVERAEVQLASVLTEATLTLEQVLRLKPGDIIPVELPKSVLVTAEGVPVLRGQFGVSDGKNSIQVSERVSSLD
jgi:flagellar motor switch protein FliM